MTTQAQLTGATAAEVAAAREALVTYLETLYPTLSMRAGPLADLILGPTSDALAAVEHRAEEAQASLDPETALADGGYDEATLAAALAGRGVTRGTAAKASGTVALKFSTDVSRTVQAGFKVRTADSVYFVATASVRLLATGTTSTFDTDVILVADPGGGYVGTFAAEAEETGATGNRPAGTSLTASTTLSGLTAAYAATDFTGGADAETDAHLLARLPGATAPRTVGSFEGVDGVIRDAVSSFSDVSVVGFGDDGMRRGRSVLTSQTPGRTDARVRTADQPGRTRLNVTATLISTGPGVWRFTIAKDDAPGWFKIDKVIQENAALSATGYSATVTRGYDVSGVTDPPDIRSAQDAMFSAFSTATVTFTDTDTSTSGMTVNVTTRDYDAVLRVIEGISDAQDAVDASTVRAVGGDCLVRCACPVLVAVTAEATTQAGVTLTEDEVSAAVAAAVNASVIDSQLSGAVVAARAVALLPTGTALQLSTWTGTAYADDATTVSVSGSTGLTVSTNWTKGLGPETVAYYCDPESVTSSVSSL